MKKHPTDSRLEGFQLAQSPEDRELLSHLLQCSRCRDRIDEIARRRSSGPASESGAPSLIATGTSLLSFAVALAAERFEAPELFVELVGSPQERWEVLLRTEPRFRTWGLFELLIERSLETATRNPDHAERLGALALALSERLDTRFYGPAAIEDLRARAWGHIANARRVRSDLSGAEEAFGAALVCLRKGSGDPLEEAFLWDLNASLRRAQRRFAEAASLLEKAVRIFLDCEDRHRAGRSLINLSTVYYFMGDLDRAMNLLRQSIEMIDAEREPRLRLCAQHNLIFYLTEVERYREALEVYRETRPLYREFGEPWVQNRRRWARGRILRGLGNAGVAESLLLEARDGFLEEGIPYDTALISLELACLYAEQGRTADLKRLAGEMIPIFSSLQIHREALAVIAFLKQAIEAETAGLEVVKAVGEYLKQAEHRPDLRFEAPDLAG